MTHDDNAVRCNGRRPIDYATCASHECTSDDVCKAFVAGDTGAACRIAGLPIDLSPEEAADVLALALRIGKRGES